MTQPGERAQIFNPDLRTLRRARAKRRVALGKGEGFLLKICAEIAAEKLEDINRDFETAIIIGLPVFRDTLLGALSPDKRPAEVIEFDDWPDVFPKDCHLIISGLVLQSLDELPQAMMQARGALRPDGLFISGILGGETLLGLKRSCFAIDQERLGGIAPRVAPMIDLQQAAGLLHMAGLALPVTDKDVCKVSYQSLATLASDLRDIGETNNLSAMPKGFMGKDYLRELERHYSDRNEQGRFSCPYEIIWMTGWSPHENQQKPLKPGSAKMHLSEALKKLSK